MRHGEKDLRNGLTWHKRSRSSADITNHIYLQTLAFTTYDCPKCVSNRLKWHAHVELRAFVITTIGWGMANSCFNVLFRRCCYRADLTFLSVFAGLTMNGQRKLGRRTERIKSLLLCNTAENRITLITFTMCFQPLKISDTLRLTGNLFLLSTIPITLKM